jgi:hypothetical protein
MASIQNPVQAVPFEAAATHQEREPESQRGGVRHAGRACAGERSDALGVGSGRAVVGSCGARPRGKRDRPGPPPLCRSGRRNLPRWNPISCRPHFFLPVRVLSRLFRRLFLQYLQEAFDSGKLRFFSSLATLQDPQAFNCHLDPVRNLKWVVYAKPPFAGPQQVVNYVGRYTHRVAISNHRIVDIDGGEVKFTWRDYRDNNQQKTMPLSADQFIGRFLLHVLPSGFHRIRYYGFLANPHRQEKLEQCRQLLGMTPTRESSSDLATLEDYRDRYERLTGRSLRECPVCHRGHMIPVANLPGVSSSPVIEDTS